MSDCDTFQCYLKELRRETTNTQRERSGVVVPRSGNIDIETNPNMRVVFPILLVIGLFVVCMVGFLIYRFGANYIRKRWTIWRQRNNSDSTNASTQQRNRQNVNTIADATFRDRPPSYRLVLASIQRDELPPSYETVIQGVVNESFMNDDNIRTNADTFGRAYENVTENNTIGNVHNSIQPALTRNDIPHVVTTGVDLFIEPRLDNHQPPLIQARQRVPLIQPVQTMNRPARRLDVPPSPAVARHHLTEHTHTSTGPNNNIPILESPNVDGLDNTSVTTEADGFELSRSKSDARANNHILNSRHIQRSATSVHRKSNSSNRPIVIEVLSV